MSRSSFFMSRLQRCPHTASESMIGASSWPAGVSMQLRGRPLRAGPRFTSPARSSSLKRRDRSDGEMRGTPR